MENEILTVALTVAQWQTLLNVISLAPFSAVNQIGQIVSNVQQQAGEQITVLQEKYPQEAPAAEAAAE
jgi:hypothetical protein